VVRNANFWDRALHTFRQTVIGWLGAHEARA
jgi:hypothetical protein